MCPKKRLRCWKQEDSTSIKWPISGENFACCILLSYLLSLQFVNFPYICSPCIWIVAMANYLFLVKDGAKWPRQDPSRHSHPRSYQLTDQKRGFHEHPDHHQWMPLPQTTCTVCLWQGRSRHLLQISAHSQSGLDPKADQQIPKWRRATTSKGLQQADSSVLRSEMGKSKISGFPPERRAGRRLKWLCSSDSPLLRC